MNALDAFSVCITLLGMTAFCWSTVTGSCQQANFHIQPLCNTKASYGNVLGDYTTPKLIYCTAHCTKNMPDCKSFTYDEATGRCIIRDSALIEISTCDINVKYGLIGLRQIRSKLNGPNGMDDPTSGSSSSSSGHYGNYSRSSGRCKTLIIAVLVFILLAIGVVITAVILLTKVSAPADVVGTYKLAATVTNMEFTEDMLDPNSEPFQTISREFCDEIDKNHSDDFGYAGCVVTGLQNGSVIIYFTIVINANGGSQATTNDTIFAFLGIELNQGSQTTLGNFVIGFAEVIQQFIQLPIDEPSPVPTKMPFNSACGNTNTQRCKTKRSICKDNVCACASDKIYVEDGDSCNLKMPFNSACGNTNTQRCKTKRSICKDNVCACASDKIYVETGDSCNLIECSEVAVIHNGNITKNGSKYGSHLKVECDDGYEWPFEGVVICQTPDSWTGIPDCLPVVCEGFVVPPNAVNESDVINKHVFKDKINVKCKPGYKVEGVDIVICQANKKWSKSPNCTMLECDDITDISYGTVTNLTGTILVADSLPPIFPMGSTVEIECDDGYEIDGNISTLRCMENGAWSPNVTCIPVVCSAFSPPDDALFVVSSNATAHTFGSSLTIKCKNGLSFADGTVLTELTCNAFKIWSGEQTCGIYAIHFDKKSGTGIVGENYTMTCIVDNMEGLQDIEITKDGINIIDDGEVFTVTRDINDISANLTIEKTIKCGDDGMYYCKPKGTSVEAQAETWISVIWKSGQPIVNLSPDIVEDSSPWSTFETLCTGEMGYKNASIYFQTNKNGKFENLTAIDSATFPVIDFNPSECSNVKTIAFTHQYTADWNGTTLRCVVQDTDRRLMDTEVINVVPESICHNKTIGDMIPHPFDCRARFTCSSSTKKLTPFSYCHEADTCYDGITPCVACEDVGRCREDPSDIVPYMECTSTVATIGQLAYINCSLHHTTIEQPNATGVTILQNGTIIIKTLTPTGNDPDTATYVPQSGDTTPTLVVRSTTIDIVFDPVSCVHKGEYILRYDNGTSTIEKTEQFAVQRTASATHLSKSTDKYYRGVETTLSCIGPIGQPVGSLELRYRRNSSDDFEPLSDSTNPMTSTYDPDNCTYIGELHYTFVVLGALDGYEYRCKSVGHDSQEFYSNIETLNVEIPAINFEDEQVAAEIGTTFEAKCMISKADGASGATITLTSDGTTNELCAVADTSLINDTVTNQPGYTAFILEDSDHWSLVVSGTAACHHEGTLHCFSPSASQIKSSSELVITRQRGNPEINVPVAFDGLTSIQDEVSCTADVGYPPLGRVLKMQKKRASEESFVDIVENVASGECEINGTLATKSINDFDLADDEAEFKCVVYEGETVVTQSSIETMAVYPNDCPTDTAENVYLPYPLDCFHRLWCYSSGSLTVQSCAAGWCFNATSAACDIQGCYSCPP